MTNKYMEGWTSEEEVAEVKLGRKTYKNMAHVSRPCRTCSKPFRIWVTQKSVQGKSSNDSLRLRNCEDHRGHSAPVEVKLPDDYAEIKKERDEIKQELTEYGETIENQFVQISHMRKEIEELKKRLAQHELPEAMKVASASVNKAPWEK